ncbi:MAG: Asp-tRNA(Asn)/Glu-tRNA(Gln) amidotransferase subunit GatA [Candidatus Omnitrophota bacterium]|nr:MAG: Asp-tRNA(Asn)/Glu-tRNA(Gln) amidotransferase subunit GatA [Candidatus Omnitrophota bacterium]
MELHRLTAHQLSDLIAQKKTSPKEIAQDLLKRIKKTEKKVKAFCFLDEKDVLRQCAELEKRTSHGALFGIPVVIKDNICVQGQDTTCSSRILKGFKPPYDATCVRRLKQEGAIIFAKGNMDEFAFGSSCETSCYGPTHNPWDLKRIPGGSSGGSAASVAADETILALGSDTGGSIRQPASLCGVVGFKPTYGRVSRYGLIAFASSLDQIGPLAKDVQDAAILLNVISGHDGQDSTCADVKVPDYTKALVNNVNGLRIGYPKEYFAKGLNTEVKDSVETALGLLRKLGAQVKEISLPHTGYAVADYYIIATAEASSNLARFDGVQYGHRASDFDNLLDMYAKTRGEGFGEEAKRRIILGTYALSSGYYDAYYLRALKARRLIKEDFDRAFKDCDCIVTPTSPTAAFKIGERIDNPLAMYLSDIYTISVNLAGLPAISVPCGFNEKGLPIGLQFIARAFEEEVLLRGAYTFEQNTDYHLKKPEL